MKSSGKRLRYLEATGQNCLFLSNDTARGKGEETDRETPCAETSWQMGITWNQLEQGYRTGALEVSHRQPLPREG